MRSRDSQRQQVYDVETMFARLTANATPETGSSPVSILGTTVVLPAQRKFGSVTSARDYVTAVMNLGAFTEAFGDCPPVAVRVRKGHTCAHYEKNMIALPDRMDMLNEHVVCHELAHHVTAYRYGHHIPGHGAQFRDVLCELFSIAMCPQAGWVLSVLFAQAGLPVGEGVKHVSS